MSESLYVNADWSELVPAGSPEAAFGITPRDAKRRGLLPLEKGETLGEPEKMMGSANLEAPAPEATEAAPEAVADEAPAAEAPEPAAKEAPAPADKQAAKPADKAARKPRSKAR